MKKVRKCAEPSQKKQSAPSVPQQGFTSQSVMPERDFWITYNRMGKTRDLFKKIRDTKGTFHAQMGLIQDRNVMELTEAEDIKKRWQEYTEELCKKKSS